MPLQSQSSYKSSHNSSNLVFFLPPPPGPLPHAARSTCLHPSNAVYASQSTTTQSKLSRPCVSLAKTDLQQLGFRLLAELSPPSRVARSPPPSPSTPAYPSSTTSLQSESSATRALLVETEPQWLRFGQEPNTPPVRIPPPFNTTTTPATK
jgi:hypothetical protein